MGGQHQAPLPFAVYLDVQFEQSTAFLSEDEQHIALDICKSMEHGGPNNSCQRLTYPTLGEVILRRQSGVLVLFREKAMGPRSYLAVAAGRYWRDPSSGAWKTEIF